VEPDDSVPQLGLLIAANNAVISSTR